MKSLNEYAKEKSNFVALKDGESYSGIFRGYKFIEKEVRGETKEYARYLLEDLTDKKVRFLDSQSGSLATKMDNVPVNSVVAITRTGEGFDTKYKVEFGDGAEKKAVEDAPLEEDEEIPIIEEDN